MKVNDFLQKAKLNAENKAKQMAALELSTWNHIHEQELKQYFGYTDKKLAARKIELQKAIR